MSGYLSVLPSVVLDAYAVSLLCLAPALLLCWLFGLRVSWQTGTALAGWGAVAVVALAYGARLGGVA